MGYRQTVFENRFFTVESDGQWTYVTPGTGKGSVIVPVLLDEHGHNPRVCLVEQWRQIIGEQSLEFPRGGTDDLGEDEARRELIEETAIGDSTMTKVGMVYPDTGGVTTHVAVWLSVSHGEVPSDYVEAETGATSHWYTMEEVESMILSGQIRCAMTISAFALVRNHNVFTLAQT